jgi:hypothetical protein
MNETDERGAEPTPPAWAEHVLRLLLTPEDRETVSGDLLEEYRVSVLPLRGRMRADVWYLRQVMGFVWRSASVWGLLLAMSIIGRDTLDWWLSPTDDFYARSIVSTSVAVALFACAGGLTAWRSRSIGSGMLAGIATGLIAGVIVNVGSLVMLAVKHDPHTMAMIRASGGLDEVFSLPILITLPGTVCATLGAAAAKTLRYVVGSRVAE